MELWDEAVKLTRYFTVSSVSAAMGLNYTALKKRVLQQNQNFLEPVSGEKFIELSCPVYPDSVSSSTQIAEIIDAGGSVLKIYSGGISENIQSL